MGRAVHDRGQAAARRAYSRAGEWKAVVSICEHSLGLQCGAALTRLVESDSSSSCLRSCCWSPEAMHHLAAARTAPLQGGSLPASVGNDINGESCGVGATAGSFPRQRGMEGKSIISWL